MVLRCRRRLWSRIVIQQQNARFDRFFRIACSNFDRVSQYRVALMVSTSKKFTQKFNILKDNEGRRKQHSRSFMARREPRVLTPNRKKSGRNFFTTQEVCVSLLACILKVSKSPNA
ncbi:hypothetical protein TNCV_3980761 [Trichonephila clavipes]|nr:hypothetical protein TNCV_3980761 [Trichonephila clavipes]